MGNPSMDREQSDSIRDTVVGTLLLRVQSEVKDAGRDADKIAEKVFDSVRGVKRVPGFVKAIMMMEETYRVLALRSLASDREALESFLYASFQLRAQVERPAPLLESTITKFIHFTNAFEYLVAMHFNHQQTRMDKWMDKIYTEVPVVRSKGVYAEDVKEELMKTFDQLKAKILEAAKKEGITEGGEG